MRGFYALPVLLLALSSQMASAQNTSISFINLTTGARANAASAVYQFELKTARDDFESATVYFTLANGLRSGCGVYVNAQCTLTMAGQTLSIKGIRTGVEGWFAWQADPMVDNHPTELSFGLAQPMKVQDYVARIIEPEVVPSGPSVPEPASWTMMIAGFALAGAAARGRRSALA